MNTERNQMSLNILEQLQLMLEDYRTLIKDNVQSDRYNWTAIYVNGFNICEKILCYIASENGYKFDPWGGLNTEIGHFNTILHPVESLEAPPNSTVSVSSQRHPEQLPEVTGTSRGNTGYPAATRERPQESVFNAS